MSPSPVYLRGMCALVLGTLLVTNSGTAHATDYKWSGGGTDHLWSNGQNWGGQSPVSSVDATVSFTGTTNLQASQDISSDFVLDSLTFTNGGGAFTISGGDLDFRANSKLAAPTINHGSFSSVVINNNLVLRDNLAVAVSYNLNSVSGAPALALGGLISGPGALTFSGSGTTALLGANTYTGGTIFAGGTVTAGSLGALGSSGTISFTGGTLGYSPGNQTDYSARFSTDGKQNRYSVDTNGQNATFATGLSSGGSLAKLGAGTLTLTGNNAFPGGVAITGGVLNVGSAGALGTAGTITFGGTLQYSAANTTDYSSRFTTADYQYASVDTNGQDVTFATGFTSTHGGFAKLGAGKLTVMGAITSGFATQVFAGTLEVPTGGSISNSYVTVAGGATFNVSGGTVGVSSSGFELGTTAGITTLNFSAGTLNNSAGDIGFVSGSTAIVNQTGGSSNSSMYVGDASGSNGSYNLSGGRQTAQAFVGYNGTGTLTQSGGTMSSGVLVGYNSGSNGSYILNAGSFSGNISVGVFGTGTFTQNGGTITNGGVGVANFSGSVGTYTLNGGTLSMDGANGGSGTGTFNFNGGTIQATASRTNFLQSFTTANVQTGGAIINTNGYNVTAAQNLVHDTANGAAATDGGLTKNGSGTLTLAGANTYQGRTTVNIGTLALGSTASIANSSGVNVAVNSAFDISALTSGFTVTSAQALANNGAVVGNVNLAGILTGPGTISGAVTVSNGGVLNGAATVNGLLTVNGGGLATLSGGTLTSNGGVVNNGTIRMERGASLAVGNGGTFTNNGTLDIITGSFSAPAGFTNNGVVINSSVVQAKSAHLGSGTFTVAIDSYSGHTYQLQRSGSLVNASYANVGSTQSGTTGTTLTFTDYAPSAVQGFYRVQVDP